MVQYAFLLTIFMFVSSSISFICILCPILSVTRSILSVAGGGPDFLGPLGPVALTAQVGSWGMDGEGLALWVGGPLALMAQVGSWGMDGEGLAGE